MNDTAFQQLILEELQAVRIKTEALRAEFTKFRLEDFTNFKLQVVEERGIRKGQSKWTTAFISATISVVIAIAYKMIFK